MGTAKPARSAPPDDALVDFYVQAVLDASGDELRAEAVDMGEDPEAIIAEARAAFRTALARCEVTSEAWPDAAGELDVADGTPDDVRTGRPRTAVDVLALEAPDPFAGFDARGLRAVAVAFGCNANLIGRLKDRLVCAEDLTAGFVEALAAALDTGAAALALFLEGPARVPAAARFKADGKPAAVAKQPLAEALDAAGLTEGQKRRLLAL